MRRKIVKMNSRAKSKIIILFTLGILLALLPIITINHSFITSNSNGSTEYRDDINFNNENLKTSEVSGIISINNNSGWANFGSDGNCTGEGTFSEPYVIEDLEIDGEWSGNCILIENSDVFFRIENCTLSYSSEGSHNAGIKLSNVTNAHLIDNDCSSNAEGIYLVDCNNNTISGNTANNNYNGIYLYNSNNNTVIGNTANDNEQNGINIFDSNNNTVSGNTATRDGIRISGNNNTISGNIMNGCGLTLYSSDIEDFESYNIDDTNLVNGKPLYYYTNEVNLGPNDFLNAGQVILVNCNDSTISNLNVSYTGRGISLHYCNNNEISNNIADNNILNGICLDNCHNNLVSGNTANNLSSNYQNDAIALISSNNNVVSGNTANNNADSFGSGIRLRSSDNNIVSGNIANNNRDRGILLYESDANEITENNVSDNWNGIYLWKSNDNIVSKNNANDNANGITLRESILNDISENIVISNDRGILIAISSDNNTILENNAKGNDYGIFVGVCFYNEILGNNASNNGYGIYLAAVFNTTISENTANNNWLYGIYLEVSLNNTISENIVNYNFMTGIILDENSNGNNIYLNCFNNTLNARDDGLNNSWDNGIKGNFWGDYNGTDLNNDGIGDTPYNITGSAGSQDYFPLMECPLPLEKPKGGLPMELIIIILVISGGAVIGVATILLIRRKRKRID